MTAQRRGLWRPNSRKHRTVSIGGFNGVIPDAPLGASKIRPRQTEVVLDFLSLHGAGDMIRLPDGKRHDGVRRIAGRAAGKLAAIRDEQILDVVGLAELVHDT